MLVKIVNGDGGEEDLTFKIESLKKILKLENVTEDNCLVLELDLIEEYISLIEWDAVALILELYSVTHELDRLLANVQIIGGKLNFEEECCKEDSRHFSE